MPPVTSAPQPRQLSEPIDWTAIALVAAVALAASLAGLSNDFVQDDTYLIRDNLRIHDLANWRAILTSPYWPPPFSQDLYRPLTALLLGFEFVIGGGDPAVFRLVSYGLYAAASTGVFLLARRLLPRPVALGAALVFAAHPVHVEAVALAAGQNELVVGLLAVTMTVRYLDRRRGDGLGARDWGGLGILYLAASLLKEQGLLLPAFLLCAEAFLLVGPLWDRVRRLGPGYAFLGLLGGAVLLVRSTVLGGDVAGTFTAEALQGVSIGGRALTMLQVVPHWARLLLWPAHLQADYSPLEIVGSTGLGASEMLGLLILLAAVVTMVVTRRRAPVVAFGIAWCAVALFPVSNVLVPTAILLAERTLFLPSIGVVITLAGLVALALDRWGVGARDRRFAAIVCGLLVIAGLLRSVERQRVWRNEGFFAVRGVQDAPRSFRAQRAYGDVLFTVGRADLGVEAYDRAIAFAPPGSGWRVRNDLARRYRLQGETAKEVEQLRASLAEEPAQEDARGHLVAGLLLLGDYAGAARAADSALARGANRSVFQGLRAVADSAASVKAPPGSVRIQIRTVPAPSPH